MDQPKRPHSGFPMERPRTILVIMPSPVFSEAFTLWCQRYVNCEYIDWATSLKHAREKCSSFRPMLLVLDPSTQHDAVKEGVAFLREDLTNHLLLLDSRPLEATLAAILSEHKTSYFSRLAPSNSLVTGIAEILNKGKRVFDPVFAGRLRRTDSGYKLDYTDSERSISLLTEREKEVMRLLAQGRTVKECGAILRIAESTAENHKSRLMKKLGVHKSAELTLQAIRCGLILV